MYRTIEKYKDRILRTIRSILAFSFLLLSQPILSQDEEIPVPLIVAVRRGDVPAVKHLLAKGADPNTHALILAKPSLADRSGKKFYQGDSALMIAAREGRIEIASLLLHKGANLNIQTGWSTPLIEATQGHQYRMVKWLLAHGAKVDVRNTYGDTALVVAANEGQINLIKILLKQGADINGGTQATPLMEAVRHENKEIVKYLLAKGASVNLHRNGWRTALEWAKDDHGEEIIPILLRAGGKGRSVDELRQEREKEAQEAKEEEAEKRTNAIRFRQERIVMPEDQEVLGAVLLYLLTDKARFLFEGPSRTDIILLNTTTEGTGLLEDSQWNSELTVTQANDISIAMREHILRRNGAPTSLADFKPTNPHILLRDASNVNIRIWEFERQFPNVKGYIAIYLPGYNEAHDRAVLRFYAGPSQHGMVGTCLLMKQGNVWQVKWHHLTYFR